ncbi:MAG: hypothetical protein WC273_01265 [Dehalococcoidia bacterium]
MQHHGRLLRAAVLAVLATLLTFQPSPAMAQQPTPTRAQLEAATYPADLAPGGSATLVAGRFEAPAAPGSASKITVSLQAVANGAIAGQPGAAVVLASSGGGSGTFFELYAMDSSAKPIAHTSLGDRIVLNAISIDSAGQIMVSMVAHAPGDPQCCPTAAQVRAYALLGGALTLVATTPSASTPTPTPPPATPPRPAATGSGGIGAREGGVGGTVLAFLALGAVLAASVRARTATRERRG